MKQHIIPDRSYQWFFRNDKGKVHYYDKISEKCREEYPKHIAIEEDFYSKTLPDGSKDPKPLENPLFSRLEGEAKAIIVEKGLCEWKPDRKIALNLQEKKILAEFICSFVVRSRGFRELFWEKWENIFANAGHSPSENDFIEWVTGEFQDGVPRYKKFAEEVLVKMNWQFTFASKDRAFITSDNPFFLNDKTNLGYKAHTNFSRGGIGNEDLAKGLPLTPKCCLLIFEKGSEIESHKLQNVNWVRRVNREIAARADKEVLANNEKLLRRVIKQVGYKVIN